VVLELILVCVVLGSEGAERRGTDEHTGDHRRRGDTRDHWRQVSSHFSGVLEVSITLVCVNETGQ